MPQTINSWTTIQLFYSLGATHILSLYLFFTTLPTHLPILPYTAIRSYSTANHSSISRLNYRPTHLSLYFLIILLIYKQTLDTSNLSLLLDTFIDQTAFLSTLQKSLGLQTLKSILRLLLFLNNNKLQTNTRTATLYLTYLLTSLLCS